MLKFLWMNWLLYYVNYINYVLKSEDPPKSWSEAIVSVLHKDGKDPLQCASYCPISLLCADYNILTSIMAARIQTDVKKWIASDETGFILGRPGSHNVRSLNLQSIAARDKQPSELLSIDAEKAFDQVEGGTIHKTALFTDDILLFIKKTNSFFHFPHLWNAYTNMDHCLDVKFMKIN